MLGILFFLTNSNGIISFCNICSFPISDFRCKTKCGLVCWSKPGTHWHSDSLRFHDSPICVLMIFISLCKSISEDLYSVVLSSPRRAKAESEQCCGPVHQPKGQTGWSVLMMTLVLVMTLVIMMVMMIWWSWSCRKIEYVPLPLPCLCLWSLFNFNSNNLTTCNYLLNSTDFNFNSNSFILWSSCQ